MFVLAPFLPWGICSERIPFLCLPVSHCQRLILIAGEIGRMYEANVDDVGYRVVAIYTPVREDGIEGQPVSASTEPIAVGNMELHSVSFYSWLCQ